jgi:hypothetical protein
MPNPETCDPRLCGFESSACQTLVVDMIPPETDSQQQRVSSVYGAHLPVPKPSMILATINCANWNDEPISTTPTSSVAVAAKMVHLRPHISPKKVQASEPNTPARTKLARTVPFCKVNTSYCNGPMQLGQTLDSSVVVLLCTLGVYCIHLRELTLERHCRKNPTCYGLIVPEDHNTETR